MSVLTSVDKHLISIKKFNAYTCLQAFREIFLFPYDYFLRNGKSHAPLNIALFLTLRCNAKCFMCNLRELLNKDRKELSLKKISEFLKEIKPYKPSIVLFGGEPLLRNDFIDILKMVKSNGLSCGIFTNGTLFNPKLIEEMIKLKMNYVAFSLQGISKHDSIVGVKGAYEKMINSIKEFTKYKKRKTKIIIHATITENNLDELGKIVELGEKLNVNLIRFGHPTFFTKKDTTRNKAVMKKLFPDEKIDEISYKYDIEEKSEVYYKKIAEFMKKYKGRFKMTPDLSLEEIKKWYSNEFNSRRKCYFVYRGCFIYPSGEVVPCESIRFAMGNINEKPFMKIWNSKKYVRFRKILRKRLLPACARCCKL